MVRRVPFLLVLITLLCFLSAQGYNPAPRLWKSASPVEEKSSQELTVADLILLGARQEVINKVTYDAAYAAISYPGGDVTADRGACTDVVIRAFRNAGIDLQERIHEDMKNNFELYPQNWGLSGPDRNIDHRRIPNQMRYFARFGQELPADNTDDPQQWQWGDVVYWRFPDGRLHCGIVSDIKTRNGMPYVIHNGGLTREENGLLYWEIIGHYRYPAEQ